MNKTTLLTSALILLCLGITTAYGFVEYSGNPFFGGSTSGVDRAYSPFVIKIDGMYNMWYGDGANARYTNSTYPDFHDAIFPGTIVTGTNASQPYKFTVYYDPDGWTLGGNFYSQKLVAYYTDAVGSWTVNPKVAVSDNGINWTFIASTTGVYGYPSLSPIYRLSVLYEGNNSWKGWADLGSPTIQYFTSTNGIAWTGIATDLLNRSNPQSWENFSYGAISPFVYKSDGVFVMVFSAGKTNNYQGIGLAYSTDGEHFIKESNNPFLSINDGIAWRIIRTYNGYIMLDDGLFRMYFQGGSAGGVYAVGMATAECILNTDCGSCMYCNAGTCGNQSSDEDLKNECSVDISCLNAYSIQSQDGFCDGMGACSIIYADVSAGNVCFEGIDSDPDVINNCDIWQDCIVGNISADQYYVGYTGDGINTCNDTDWQSIGTTWNATVGYQISITEKADVCQEISIPSSPSSSSETSAVRRGDYYYRDAEGNIYSREQIEGIKAAPLAVNVPVNNPLLNLWQIIKNFLQGIGLNL